MKPTDLGYKRLHCQIGRTYYPKQLVGPYESVTITPKPSGIDRYFLYDSQTKRFKENDEVGLIEGASNLSLTEFAFTQRTYEVRAKTIDWVYCRGDRWALKISAPCCETLKLKVWDMAQLYHIQWGSLEKLKRVDLSVDGMRIERFNDRYALADTLGILPETPQRVTIRLKS